VRGKGKGTFKSSLPPSPIPLPCPRVIKPLSFESVEAVRKKGGGAEAAMK
jgi:hypothetical protein